MMTSLVFLQFVADTKIHCRCHGFSGSCSVRTCRFLTPNMDEIGAHARREYTFSVQVTTNITTKEITPVNSIAVTNLANSPVHLNSSPNFCNADIPNGIPGTKGRKCSRVTGAIDSCDVVCCQRGAEARIIERPKECCDFVWCCRVECKPCGVETFTEYVCKQHGHHILRHIITNTLYNNYATPYTLIVIIYCC